MEGGTKFDIVDNYKKLLIYQPEINSLIIIKNLNT